nr:MAG TPA: hypothetical protein [Caudoviricetes sp.]
METYLLIILIMKNLTMKNFLIQWIIMITELHNR